ncbi:MAG: disulfide bond formation protein B [Rudaea sp.]
MNPLRWSFRTQCAAGFVVCAALLAYAYFVQFALNVEPCPMCIFQRIVFIVMGLVFLSGAIQSPQVKGRRVYAFVLVLVACAGIGIAARHLWLQHQPSDPFAGCTPGWNYMVSNFPIGKTLRMAFTGLADCAKVSWVILGLSMPTWSLISYVLLGAGALWAGLRKRPA